MDVVAAKYNAPDLIAKLCAARNEYDEARGKVFDDDEHYNAHVTAFLEWFVLERPLEAGLTPGERALSDASLSAEQRFLLKTLLRGQHSLFELTRKFRAEVFLRDVLGNSIFAVELDDQLNAISEGEIFESRLVAIEFGGIRTVRLGPTQLFHPRSAYSRIEDIVRLEREQRKLGIATLDRLAKMWLNHQRFRQIAIEHVYGDGFTGVKAA